MKVYFNNSCKICRSEINLYKKEEIEEIDWIDITNNEPVSYTHLTLPTKA